MRLFRLQATAKQLSRSVNAYIKRRDKMVNTVWRKDMLPLLKSTENAIKQTLLRQSLTDWHIEHLRELLNQIRTIIERTRVEFTAALARGQERIAIFSGASVDVEAKVAGLLTPGAPILSGEVLSAIEPLTRVFADIWPDIVAKQVGGEVSLGLVNQLTPHEVAENLADKFGNTSERIKKLKQEQKELGKRLARGDISKAKYERRIRIVNKELAKGSPMSFARAERIARTEMNRAASIARESRQMEVGEMNPDARRIWLDAHKPGARATHLATESASKNNPVAVDQPFNVSGYEAMYPLDPILPPKESVHCACVVTLITQDMVDETGAVKIV